MSVTTINGHRRIRDWWKEQIDGKDDIDLDALTDAAMKQLLEDERFLDYFIDNMLRPIVRDTGQRIVAKRTGMVATNGHRHTSRAVLIAEIEHEVAQPGPLQIFEHDRTGRARNLLDMTYEQVIAAAQERYDQGRESLRRAALYKLIAQDMHAGQRVKDRWTDEEIDRLYDQVDIRFGYRRVESLAAGKDQT